MGQDNERQGRPRRRPLLPSRLPTPAQIADADNLLSGLHSVRAVSDFERDDLKTAVNTHKVTDPVIDVEELSRYGSKRIKNLIQVVETSPGYDKVPEDSMGSLEHALRLAEEAEVQLRGPIITRRGLVLGFGGVIAASLLAVAYSQVPSVDQRVTLAPTRPPTPSPALGLIATFTPMPRPSATIAPPTIIPTPETALPRMDEESKKWEKVLGVAIDIKPYPPYLTEDLGKKLKSLGLQLAYMPGLQLGAVDDLQRKSEGKYLVDLQGVYPLWRRYESLNDGEKNDYRVSRNMSFKFWEAVNVGKIDFPVLPGQWIAVEMAQGGAIRGRLGLRGAQETWVDVDKALRAERSGFLAELALKKGSDLRMLEAVEYNLLSNREGWGKLNQWEWTNTQVSIGDWAYRVTSGYHALGGAAAVGFTHAQERNWKVSFRVAAPLAN